MQKNTSGQKLTVFAFDATTNTPKSADAANITAYYDLDDAGVTVLTDTSATEKDATNAKGYYIFDLAQAETNGNKILFSAKSSTANIVVIAVPAVVYTVAPNYPLLSIDSSGRIDVGKILGTASAGAAGYVGLDWGHVNAPTTTVNLSGTTVSVATTATNLTNAPTAGDFTAAMKTSLNAATPAVTVSDKTGFVLLQAFPSNFAVLGISPAGKISEVILTDATTNLTNLPAIPTNWLTADGIAAGALNGKGDWSTYAGGDTAGTTTLLARLGVPTGASIAADLAEIEAETDALLAGVVLAASQPNYAPLTALGTNAPAGWLNTAAFAAGAINATVAPNLDATVSSRFALTSTLSAARALDSIADTALTGNDAMHCAVAIVAGQRDNSTASTQVSKTAAGTTLRTHAVTLAAPGITVPVKIA